MFVDIPQTAILMVVGAFLVGWLLSSISSSLGSKYRAQKRDPRDDRIRSLEAEVRIATPVGRRSLFRAVSRAEPSGTARIRVPYSTEASESARATGPYTVRIGGASWQVRVPEAAVREGRVLSVPPSE